MKKAKRLKKPAQRKMSDREYAYGWLVFGMGKPMGEAGRIAATAPIRKIELWAKKQKAALRGFGELIRKAIAESESSPAKPPRLGDGKPDAGAVQHLSCSKIEL